MHLSSCLNPKRVWNPHIKEFMYVPCGKCEACRNKRVFNWTQRLEYECRCWKYVAFVTLTYDDDHLPKLKYINDLYVDLSHSHTADGVESPCVDLGFIRNQPDVDVARLNDWISVNPEIPYLSVYDVQCFIKRFRKNLYNSIKKQFKTFDIYDYKVRYYCCGEYGSSFARPHYHLLFFFNSEKASACFNEVLFKSWKLGITDWSYVTNSASSYVSSYLNCDSNLSPVYKYCKQIRPFSLCSKQPPLGTLFFDDSEIRQIFDKCSPTFSLPNFAKQAYVDVPLWNTFTYRLYPRISCFDKVSHSDRVRLYRVFETAQNYFKGSISEVVNDFLYFYDKKIYSGYFLHLYDDYINALAENVNGDFVSLRRSLVRWFSISSRVCQQAELWMMSVSDYVSKIELFYENVEKQKLQSQYEFLSDYSERYEGIPIAFYLDFLMSICDFDLSLADVPDNVLQNIRAFNLDENRLFSDDIEVRQHYVSELMLDNQVEFFNYSLDHKMWSRKLVKNKKKNEYILAHPDKSNLIY